MNDLFDIIVYIIEYLSGTAWTFSAFGSTWSIPLFRLICALPCFSLVCYVVYRVYDYTNY